MSPPTQAGAHRDAVHHPGGNPGANPKSISHICHPIMVACVWGLTKETINLPLGCLPPGLHMGGCKAVKILGFRGAVREGQGGPLLQVHEHFDERVLVTWVLPFGSGRQGGKGPAETQANEHGRVQLRRPSWTSGRKACPKRRERAEDGAIVNPYKHRHTLTIRASRAWKKRCGAVQSRFWESAGQPRPRGRQQACS